MPTRYDPQIGAEIIASFGAKPEMLVQILRGICERYSFISDAALRQVADAHKVPLAAAALQFALAHPVVCSVLTGPKSPAELAGIIDWWNTPIPAGFWRDLADRKLLADGTPLPH